MVHLSQAHPQTHTHTHLLKEPIDQAQNNYLFRHPHYRGNDQQQRVTIFKAKVGNLEKAARVSKILKSIESF